VDEVESDKQARLLLSARTACEKGRSSLAGGGGDASPGNSTACDAGKDSESAERKREVDEVKST
jgi:hypothetical protein